MLYTSPDLEQGMDRICPIPRDIEVVLDCDEGPGVKGDAPELLPLADHVNDGLVPVGLEIPGLKPVGISESLFGKGTAGGSLEISFKIEGFLPIAEGNCSFYAPGSVF